MFDMPRLHPRPKRASSCRAQVGHPPTREAGGGGGVPRRGGGRAGRPSAAACSRRSSWALRRRTRSPASPWRRSSASTNAQRGDHLRGKVGVSPCLSSCPERSEAERARFSCIRGACAACATVVAPPLPGAPVSLEPYIHGDGPRRCPPRDVARTHVVRPAVRRASHRQGEGDRGAPPRAPPACLCARQPRGGGGIRWRRRPATWRLPSGPTRAPGSSLWPASDLASCDFNRGPTCKLRPVRGRRPDGERRDTVVVVLGRRRPVCGHPLLASAANDPRDSTLPCGR